MGDKRFQRICVAPDFAKFMKIGQIKGGYKTLDKFSIDLLKEIKINKQNQRKRQTNEDFFKIQ